MRVRFAFALACVLFFGACGGGSNTPTAPTASTSSTPATSTSSTRQTFFMGFSATRPFSATLAGQSYTAAGPFSISLEPGVYELAGSFSAGDNFAIAFLKPTLDGGGVQSGSLTSLSGPNLITTLCTAIYGLTTSTQNFRLRFTVTSNANSTCRG
jgi:hypothetical protein